VEAQAPMVKGQKAQIITAKPIGEDPAAVLADTDKIIMAAQELNQI
jgi:hypothetical protein